MSAATTRPGRIPPTERRPRSWVRVVVLAAVLVTVLVPGACAGPAGPTATRAELHTSAPGPSATSPGASSGVGTTPVAGTSATPAAGVTPERVPIPTATAAPPPVAVLVAPDATIVGLLGTYVIDGRGSDAPWQPFDTLPTFLAGPREVLEIRLADGVRIGSETQVLLAAAEDLAGADSRAAPGAAISPDGTRLLVGPLPIGRWVLAARVFRADGRGDGTTFWALTVG